MARTIKALMLLTLFLIPAVTLAAGEKQASFSPHVDSKGNITLPSNFLTKWTHLGTWVVTSKAPIPGAGAKQTSPGAGIHEVYTQPKSLKAYKKSGKWPDGAVLIKEIRAIKWDDLPTGHVMLAGETTDWFVMVKDSKGRFKNNPNWGDGWGWALFRPANPKKNISANYKNDCMGCHDLAADTDWVFIQGYPVLK